MGAPRKPAVTAAEWRASLVVAVLFFLIGHGTLHWAEQIVPSGIAALLVATEPFDRARPVPPAQRSPSAADCGWPDGDGRRRAADSRPWWRRAPPGCGDRPRSSSARCHGRSGSDTRRPRRCRAIRFCARERLCCVAPRCCPPACSPAKWRASISGDFRPLDREPGLPDHLRIGRRVLMLLAARATVRDARGDPHLRQPGDCRAARLAAGG